MSLAALHKAHREPVAEPPPDVVAYDVETSGTDTRHDQVLQFASVLANSQLQPVSETEIEIRRLPYVVPAPEALAVTGFDPFALDSNDRTDEYEAAIRIRDILKVPGGRERVFVTFNGHKFDDEILRTTLFRNLLDPYATSGASSSRVDALAMARLSVAMRPGAIATETNDNGSTTWKLASLCRCNGIAIDAHDAGSDTRATISLAALIRAETPFAWDRSVACGNSARAKRMLSRHLTSREPLWMFTHYSEGALIPLLVLGSNDTGKWLAADLRVSPSSLPDEIAEIETLSYGKDVPFRQIKSSGAPILFTDEEAEAIALSHDASEASAGLQHWLSRPALLQSALAAFRRSQFTSAADASSEDGIYSGFPDFGDRRKMDEFHCAAGWDERAAITFTDRRLVDFAARLVLRRHSGLSPELEETLKSRCAEAIGRPIAGPDCRRPSIDGRSENADERWRAWAAQAFAPLDSAPAP